MLEVRLLGTSGVFKDGTEVKIKRRKALGLLYYLASSRRAVSRGELVGMLWPDIEDAAARHAVSVALSDLKSSSPDLIAVDGQRVLLGEAVAVDAAAFEDAAMEAARSGDADCAERASLLYRGEFLNDFEVPAEAGFSLWKEREAERFRQLFVDMLQKAAESAFDEGDCARAIRYVSRAIEVDPLREDLYAAGMRYSYRNGNRVQAIKQYRCLRDVLKRELSIAPSASTERLYRAIVLGQDVDARRPVGKAPELAGPADGARTDDAHAVGALAEGPCSLGSLNLMPSLSADLPFVGREQEMGLLDKAMRDGCRIICLEGESGMGKTRLACEYFGKREGFVLYAAAHALDGAAYCQPVVAAFQRLAALEDWARVRQAVAGALHPVWLDVIARYVPGLFDRDEGAYESRGVSPSGALLFDAIDHLASALCQIAPVSIVVDDVQSADSAVFELFDRLVSDPSSRALRVVLIHTSGQYASPSSEAAFFELLHGGYRAGSASVVTLGPLGYDDVAELVRRAGGESAAGLEAWLMHYSEGVPYYLKEAMLSLHEGAEGLALPGSASGGGPSGEPMAITDSMAGYVLIRLARLSGDARRVADLASVVGRDFDIELVAKAGGFPEERLLDALEELCAARLVKPGMTENEWKFDHGITHAVVYKRLNALRRKSVHRRIAKELERSSDPSRVRAAVEHYRRAGMGEAAARCAVRASEAMFGCGSWREGIALIKQGMTVLEGEERLVYLKRQGIMLCAMHSDAASEMYEKTAVLAQELGHGAFSAHCRGVARMVRSPDMYEVLCGMPVTLAGCADPYGSYAFLAKAAAMLEERDAGEEFYVAEHCDNQLALGLACARMGDLRVAVEHFERGIAVACEHGGGRSDLRRSEVVLRMNLCSTLVDLGDADAVDAAVSGLAAAEEARMHYVVGQFLVALCKFHLDRGDLDQAKAYLDRAEEEASAEIFPYIVSYVQEQHARYDALRGEAKQAADRFKVVWEMSRSQGLRHQSVRVGIALEQLAGEGGGDEGVAETVRRIVRESDCVAVRLIDGRMVSRNELLR